MGNLTDDALLSQVDLAINSASTSQVATATEWWSTRNAMTMCSILLLFGLVVLGMTAYLLKHGHSSQNLLRIFGTFLVIIMAVFLVVAGYSNEQLGAPLGLLGTIVGYLLGRQTSAEAKLLDEAAHRK